MRAIIASDHNNQAVSVGGLFEFFQNGTERAYSIAALRAVSTNMSQNRTGVNPM
jgi:hypothetical protein